MGYSNFLDKYILKALKFVSLDKYYKKTLWFREFCRFSITTFIVFWGVRSPMTYFFTEFLRLHYLVSSFISGVVLSIIGFVVNKLMVFNEQVVKKGDEK